MLRLYGQSYNPKEIDMALLRLIKRQDFQKYADIIKSHARSSENHDRLNLAASHFNLGVVFQMQSSLELAAYHFAQANAYQPNEKYAQAWTDVQHQIGNYNPLDTLMERTIEAAGLRPPPESAMLQPGSKKLVSKKVETQQTPQQVETLNLRPVELSPLTPNLQSQELGTTSAEESQTSQNGNGTPVINEPKSLAPLELD